MVQATVCLRSGQQGGDSKCVRSGPINLLEAARVGRFKLPKTGGHDEWAFLADQRTVGPVAVVLSEAPRQTACGSPAGSERDNLHREEPVTVEGRFFRLWSAQDARQPVRALAGQGRSPPNVRCDPPTVSRALARDNALAHAPAKSRTAVAAMLETIFAQETRAEADARWDAVADALREKNDRLGAMMDASRDDVLAYMDLPREHWAQIRSTDPLERVKKETKRRADVVGIFPKDAAIIRLCGALMIETNDGWTVARRYMGLGRWPASPILTTSGCRPWRPDQLEPLQSPDRIHHAAGHYHLAL